MPPVIEVEQLTKRFGSKVLAVDDVSFGIEAGSITGVLGPNGAGKTTTLRMILTWSAHVRLGTRAGQPLPRPAAPARRGWAPCSTRPASIPGRSGRNALRVIAAAAGLPPARVDASLEMVELTGSARRAVKGYSTGMQQRLALAAALLGDPEVLLLDEPANGLDPEGIRWLRGFLRDAPPRAAPCSCPATCWPRWNRPSTTCSSSARADCWRRAPSAARRRGCAGGPGAHPQAEHLEALLRSAARR